MVRSRRAVAGHGTGRLVLQIYDELLFEAPEAEADQIGEIVCREMIPAYDLVRRWPYFGIGEDWRR